MAELHLMRCVLGRQYRVACDGVQVGVKPRPPNLIPLERSWALRVGVSLSVSASATKDNHISQGMEAWVRIFSTAYARTMRDQQLFDKEGQMKYTPDVPGTSLYR